MSFVLTMAGLFAIATLAGFAMPFVASLVIQRSSWRTIAPLLFALALIGACSGIAGGMSRTAAVGDIIPAFLGLLGGVAVYLFGVDQSRGAIASFGAAALSIALLIGYAYASQFRNGSEEHRDIRALCAAAFTNADLLASDAAFTRFRAQMGRLCDSSMSWNVTTRNPT